MKVAGIAPTVSRIGELLDIHPQDLREAHQDATGVDAALAAPYLGKLRLGAVATRARAAHRAVGRHLVLFACEFPNKEIRDRRPARGASGPARKPVPSHS